MSRSSLAFTTVLCLAVLTSGCSLSLGSIGLGGLTGTAAQESNPAWGSAGTRNASSGAGRDRTDAVHSGPPLGSLGDRTAQFGAENPAAIVTTSSRAGPQRVYPRAYALVIGNDLYQNKGWTPLKKAVSDAESVRDALRNHGFEVTFAKNVGSRELRDLLEEFFITKGADKQSGLVLWFAGHGTTQNGEGYIVPVDAPAVEDDARFRRSAISMREFGRLMREARASHVLSIFDSCFAGTVFKTGRSGRPPAIERALTYPVRQYISAGDHTQEVADNGEFQRLFVDAILGREPLADHDRNGYVTARELGIFMQTQMANRSDGRQAPQFGELAEGEFDRGDFVFNVGAVTGRLASLATPGLPEMSTRAPRRDVLSNMRSTKVYVGNVVGAEGDGNVELRDAISKKLSQLGFEVIDVDSEYAFKIQGIVNSKPLGLLVDEVAVRWIVLDPKRTSLGNVDQVSEVISGSRKTRWGTAAIDAADFAAKRMSRLLVRT